MKITKLIPAFLAAALISLTGCKQLTPQGAAALTTLAVYEFGKENPKITKTMREIQPLACDAALNPTNTIENVVWIIQKAGVDTETKEVLNVLLTIYQVSVAPIGDDTVKTRPYFEAVICQGWAGGLALLPVPVEKNAVPKYVTGQWLRVK